MVYVAMISGDQNISKTFLFSIIVFNMMKHLTILQLKGGKTMITESYSDIS